jgi:hypothetical protein
VTWKDSLEPIWTVCAENVATSRWNSASKPPGNQPPTRRRLFPPLHCPRCKAPLRHGRLKPRTIRTLHGEVDYIRTVYECPACRLAHAPLDREMGVAPHEHMTLRVIRKVAYEVAHASFPEAEKHLLEQLDLAVSASECQRVSLQYGARLDELQRQREAAWTAPWTEQERPAPPERHPIRLVVEADAASALTRKGEENKMVYCGTAFAMEERVTPEKGVRPMIGERRYTASGVSGEDFRDRLKALAERMDAHGAEAVAFVGDGAPCLWAMAREVLPKNTVLIQDYWHVCEHLADGAKLIHPGDGEACANLSGEFKSLLWRGEVGQILARLREASKRLRGQRRQDVEREIGYLEHGRERMDYPCYRAAGWLIGSGAVEGTCKHLVKERFNVTGARWKRANIPCVLALRLSIFNGEWADDWERLRQAA